jgi:predicted Zn-dependent protease
VDRAARDEVEASLMTRRVHPVRLALIAIGLVVALCLAMSGCTEPGGPGGGPGGRQQRLLLTPEQELRLGREAYQEILGEARREGILLRPGDPAVQRVRKVGQRLAKAAEIEPLQREINLRLKGYRFEWDFNVLRDRQVNAFALPGGKVGVFTGLLDVARDDDELATAMSHEIAHALAHHASERLAQRQMLGDARQAADGGLDSLDADSRQRLVGLLSGGTALGSNLSGLAHSRFQESEADHIGVFLMTFGGYEPEAAVVFWERMSRLRGRGGQPPEILSTHPSDGRRIAQLREWVPRAKGGKRAYDAGHIAPPP